MTRKAKTLAVLCAFASVLLTSGNGAWARDLPKSDPDRLAILDAARGKDDVKFIVKDLVKDGNFAFLCALKQLPGGGIAGTDEMLDVYSWVLLRNEKAWIPVDAAGGFAKDSGHVDCAVKHGGVKDRPKQIKNQQDIASVLIDVLRYGIQAELDFGRLDDAQITLLGLLRKRKLLTDLDIEHEKDKLDPVQLAVARGRCPSAECEESRKAFETLNQWRADAKISSLVWNLCKFGLRVGNLVAIRQCVSQLSPLPHCRPNLKIVADRKDIDQCIAESRELCRRTIDAKKCF